MNAGLKACSTQTPLETLSIGGGVGPGCKRLLLF
jgi:hypothetical protein